MWNKTTFTEFLKQAKESPKLAFYFKQLSYLPALIVYGITTILLLKFSQILLHWQF